MIPYETILRMHTGLTGWKHIEGHLESPTRVVFAHEGAATEVQTAIFEVVGNCLYLSINGNAAIIGLELEMVPILYSDPPEGRYPPLVGTP